MEEAEDEGCLGRWRHAAYIHGMAVYHLTAVTMFYFRDESCPPLFRPFLKIPFRQSDFSVIDQSKNEELATFNIQHFNTQHTAPTGYYSTSF
jgi:hypothetical protein